MIQCILPVGFKLGVPFSLLYADGYHPVKNEETCTRYGIERKEQANGERSHTDHPPAASET